jgi:hypothetical protein
MTNTQTITIAVLGLLCTCIIAGAISLQSFHSFLNTQVSSKNQAVQTCLEVARGTRIIKGQTAEESWELNQVDINYEIVARCLQEKGIEQNIQE